MRPITVPYAKLLFKKLLAPIYSMCIIHLEMEYDFTKVQEVINERGMTLAEVGARSGVHYSTISKALERGTAHQSTAKKICKALRIPLRNLLRSGESNAA